jgi:hypothetical protein
VAGGVFNSQNSGKKKGGGGNHHAHITSDILLPVSREEIYKDHYKFVLHYLVYSQILAKVF